MLLRGREFQSVGEQQSGEAKCRLRTMQWNLLARGLSVPGNGAQPCTDPAHLDWVGHRFPMIVKELTRYSPDVISVEELDQKDDLMAALEPLGYQCIYSANPDSPCLSLKPPSEFGPDGVAIIYKTAAIEVVSHDVVSLENVANAETGKVSKKLVIVALLRMKQSGFVFRFVVVHLKAKKAFAQVRANQFQQLANYLSLLPDVDGKQVPPTIISGDFNAEPDEPVISLAVQSGFSSVLPISGDANIYSTAKFQADTHDPSKTIHRHVRLIDYVFYSNSSNNNGGNEPTSLRPRSYLKMPNVDELGATLLPAACYPSDHLSLVVDFDVFSPH